MGVSTALDTIDHDAKAPSDHHAEHVGTTSDGNLHYENDEEEPEIHARTYVAVGSVIVFTIAGLLSLQGPPAVVRTRVSFHFDEEKSSDRGAISFPTLGKI